MEKGLPASALACLAAAMEGSDARWVVGGSTGLVLRGAHLERAPRDLDIYVDEDAVSIVHDRLVSYALDNPEASLTERYESTLSHYEVEGTVIELVGHFRIRTLQSIYVTEVNDFLYPHCDKVEVNGYKIPLVPIGHELIFNLLRERKDRAALAAELIIQDSDRHVPVLLALLQRNQLSATIVAEALTMSKLDSEIWPVSTKGIL